MSPRDNGVKLKQSEIKKEIEGERERERKGEEKQKQIISRQSVGVK